MIRAVVFSKDRPMQLDALLRSIDTFTRGLYLETLVLYRPTSPEMAAGYELCGSEHPTVHFWSEELFARDLGNACQWTGELVFHCDDDLFFRPLEIADMIGPGRGVFCHSYRLGQNTTHCHPLNEPQRIPLLRLWDWSGEPERSDFSYPFSLDGHLMWAETVREILAGIDPPANPNQLEARGVSLVRSDPDRFGRYMTCGWSSCLVSVPANRVQDEFPNPCSTNPEWAPAALLERYLAGERIRFERMDFTGVVGAHQEIPLVIA